MRHQPLRRLVSITAVVAALGLGAVGCSGSKELGYDGPAKGAPTTTEDPLNASNLMTGAAGIAELNKLLDAMMASQDPCAILTQRDVEKNKLDPSLFTSPEARRVLTQGLIRVFDHLILISPAVITAPLQAQKDTFTKVLDVVERYANNPGATGANAEIDTLTGSQSFVTASSQISAWIASACRS
jgi:hypothetical protein